MKRLISLILLMACLLTCLPMTATAARERTEEKTQTSKLVALTFDDGPSGYTEGLLDGLAERGAKATFFIVGQNAASHKETVKRIFQEGHQVAQHTYTHPMLSRGNVAAELSKTDDVLDESIGTHFNYALRPPYGDYNSNVLSQIHRPAIIWSVDTLDWKYRDSSYVCNQILKNIGDGEIILMHDIHRTTIPGVLAAIDKLEGQGYEFVTINELFRRRGVKLEDGVAYTRCKNTGVDYGSAKAPAVVTTAVLGGVKVSMSANSGEKIYYTVDGSDPVVNGTLYQGAFELRGPANLKAVAAFDLNGDRSETITTKVEVKAVEAPSIRVENGKIVLSSGIQGAKVFYTTDGSFPDGSAKVYEKPLELFDGMLRYRTIGDAMYSAAQTIYVTKNGNLFFDVPTSAWYAKQVDEAVTTGLFNGTDACTFEPETKMSRAMFVTTLYRMLEGKSFTGKGEEKNFPDVEKDSWYEKAVVWAAANGVVEGYDDGLFYPHQSVSREEMCVILDRLFTKLEITQKTSALAFEDKDEISPWAKDSVAKLAQAGIIIGDNDNRFCPLMSATRAEVATALLRVKAYMKENPPKEEPTEPTEPTEPGASTVPSESTEPSESQPTEPTASSALPV